MPTYITLEPGWDFFLVGLLFCTTHQVRAALREPQNQQPEEPEEEEGEEEEEEEDEEMK